MDEFILRNILVGTGYATLVDQWKIEKGNNISSEFISQKLH